jgi:hypothetical protein
MHDPGLFNNPALNRLLMAAEVMPITTGEFTREGQQTIALGLVTEWDTNGRIYGVAEFPISFSMN